MDVAFLLGRQTGVITTEQAVAAGLSARTVRRRAQAGEWEQLHPGVHLVRGHRLTPEARIRAAWLWAGGERATVTGPAAAFWHRVLQRHVGLAALRRSHHRNLGGRGSRELGRLLAVAAGGGESEAERLLVRLLRRAGVTGWVLGHPFGPHRLDLAFPAQRVAVEVDGWAFHSDVARFQSDRRKGNAITRQGWDLLRYTWHDLDGRPAECVREIVETVG